MNRIKFKYFSKIYLIYKECIEEGDSLGIPEVDPVLQNAKDGMYIFRPSKNKHIRYIVIYGRWFIDYEGEAFDASEYFPNYPTPKEWKDLIKYRHMLSPRWKQYVDNYQWSQKLFSMKREELESHARWLREQKNNETERLHTSS